MGVKVTRALREEASDYYALVERARRLGVETAVSFADEGETVAELRTRVAYAEAERVTANLNSKRQNGDLISVENVRIAMAPVDDGPLDRWGGW